MLTLKNVVRVAIAGAVMVAVVVVSGGEASARPKYLTVATATYPDLAKKQTDGKLTCAMCHPGTKKTDRNNYGLAVGKGLGKKNETDEAKIKEAITKAEKEASKTEGKTFGDLIKEGTLPGTNEVAQ
ncbi:MAG: hypothetical protein JNL58_22950 [Planctomyces sp.]|nr:hypothetical protein [Planctomyces sp.]